MKLLHVPDGDQDLTIPEIDHKIPGTIFGMLQALQKILNLLQLVDAWAKRYSKSYNDSDAPWQRFFDPMALKTVLRKVLKYAPMSITLPQEPDIEKIPVPVTEDTVPVDYEVVDDDVPEGESGESPTNKDTTSERNSQEEKPVTGSKEPTQ